MQGAQNKGKKRCCSVFIGAHATSLMWFAKDSTTQGLPNVWLQRRLHVLMSENTETPPQRTQAQQKFCTTVRTSQKADSKHLLRRLVAVSAVVPAETQQGREINPSGKTCSVTHFAWPPPSLSKHFLLYSASSAGRLMLPGSMGKQAVTY